MPIRNPIFFQFPRLPLYKRKAANSSKVTKKLFYWLPGFAEKHSRKYGSEAKFLVYYAGHGVPDEDGNCYLLPVDGDINDARTGYSLKTLYDILGKITAKSTLVLIDACFSGNDRNDVSMLSETKRGFVREINSEPVSGSLVVLSAASGKETALSYNEKGHGMFSYYLMKKLQETKGNVTYGDLFDYVKENVDYQSSLLMEKSQTPSATCSDNIRDSWKNMKF